MPRPRKRFRKILPWACLFLVILILVPLGRVDAAPRAVATVLARRGALTVQSRGVGPFLPLGFQAALSAGDVIRTGPDGEAALLFRDGQQIKLNANSSLRIPGGAPARREQSLFQALLGVIWAHLRPGQKIEAPSANIVVRGTEVLLDVDPNGTTTLTVTEGEASFFNAQGTVEVAASQQSVARPGQAPTPPVAVDVSGLLVWTADVAGLPLEFEMPSPPPGPPGLPDDAGVWVRRGQASRRQGDLPGALAAFTQAERLSPNNAEARVGMALTFLSQGREAEARAALEPVRDQATALAVLGLADLHGGQSADAVRDLQASLTADPKLAPARALLALAYLTRNALPDADREARAAAAQQPDSAQTEGTLAMVLFFEGQSKAAEAASRRAVRLNPQSPFALLAEGRALLAQQQTDAARTAYENAAALAPYFWLVHQELGLVYLRLDMPKKAAEEYRIALERNPASADAHTGLGLALERQGQFAEAEREHRQAITLDPNNVAAHGNLAALLIVRGRLDEARQELETGVRAAPDRGILYARLAELSLYRQDLFAAQEFARRAVRLLPDSAVAHYELGRVYLEQERTVQAEQEFRQATTLDRQFAAARYALGLTEQKTETGLLSSFSTLLGSALIGSPGSTLSLENLQTPGAEQRIQAALLDPTVVRVASRSYGNTELDAQFGEQGTRDLAASFLTDTPDGRGVRGVTGEEQATNGVRANADSKSDDASIVFGQKAPDSPSGLFILGEYEETDSGLDTGITSDPDAAALRFHTKLPRLIAGMNIQTGEHSRLRALIQGSNTEEGQQTLDVSNQSSHINIGSLNGEVRWDLGLGEKNLLSAGVSYGSRRLRAVTTGPADDPSQPLLQEVDVTRVRPLQLYLRDEMQVNSRLAVTGEIQILRLNTFQSFELLNQTDIPSDQESYQTTVGLPNLIAAFRPDARSAFRFRARRTFATLSDFELLTPTDVFLLSYAGLPQTRQLFAPADGKSLELEYDRTFVNAAFLRIGAFQQEQQLSSFVETSDGHFKTARLRGVRASYEGLLTPTTSFFLSADLNDARDTGREQRVPQVPNFAGLATLQYLNPSGYYSQAAYYYQGDRILSTDDSTRLGGFGLLSLRVGKRNGLRTNIFAEVTNVLNKQYDVFGNLQAGRQLNIGISERF